MRGTAIYFMLFLLPLFFACKETHKQSVDDTETIVDDTVFIPDDDPVFDEEDISEIELEEEDIPETESLPDNDLWDTLDEDGDGITNGHECTADPCEDTDGDGTPDYQDTDSDGDSIPDSVEAPTGIPIDTDNDDTPDFQDTDSDDDGISDSVEAAGGITVDTDDDGKADYRDVDSDDDAIPDEVECPEQLCVDTDHDGTPDYRDTDSDNDTIEDMYEGGWQYPDRDGDGLPNYLDEDSDGDGLLDKDERGSDKAPRDTDGDDIPDFWDTDSDNDGLSDADEKAYGTDPTRMDTDGDEVDDNTEVLIGCDPLMPDPGCTNAVGYIIVAYYAPARNLTFHLETPSSGISWEMVTTEIVAVANPYGIDPLDFVQSMNTSYAEPDTGIQSKDASAFYLVVPGTVLFYDIVLQNTFFESASTEESSLFILTIKLIGDESVIVTKDLWIIVPPLSPQLPDVILSTAPIVVTFR